MIAASWPNEVGLVWRLATNCSIINLTWNLVNSGCPSRRGRQNEYERKLWGKQTHHTMH